MKIYALAVWAQRDPDYRVMAILSAGPADKAAAHAEGLRIAREEFPSAEGWTGHKCNVADAMVAVRMEAAE